MLILEILLGVFLVLLCIFTYQGIKTLRLRPREIAREIAKAQLATYKKIITTRSDLQGEELYEAILKYRLTYNDRKTDNVLSYAKDLINKEGKSKINLRWVAWAMAILEYEEMRTKPLSLYDEVEMMDEVIKIIPDKI